MSKDSNYKVEGIGTTPKNAEAGLKKERTSLTKKLNAGDAPTDLIVVRRNYEGEFSVKKDSADHENMQSFSIKVSEGFPVLTQKASRKVNNLRNYDSTYTAQEFIDLTANQKEALTPRRKTTPAGYTPKTNSFDEFRNRF